MKVTKQKLVRQRNKLINCLHNLNVKLDNPQELETSKLQRLVYKHYEVINYGSCLSCRKTL